MSELETSDTSDDAASPGRLPDWIIIGAMKAATSSLHRYLAEHPQVATSTPKELDFFVEPRYDRLGIDWYRRQFATPADAVVAGESSVNYTKCHEMPGVAGRMHRHLPDVKLIYVLRDPVKRIESHWVHMVGSGKWRGDFASAVADPETSDVVQTSRYWMQLSEYLEHYSPEQIKVMSYEAVSADPEGAVDEVLEFIGLEPGFRHPLIGKQVHPSSRKMRPNRLGLLVWDDPVRRRRVRKYLRRVVASPIEKPVWSPDARANVADYLAPDVERIREFSGMEFAEWSI